MKSCIKWAMKIIPSDPKFVRLPVWLEVLHQFYTNALISIGALRYIETLRKCPRTNVGPSEAKSWRTYRESGRLFGDEAGLPKS